MEWIKLTKENKPNREVLAANFAPKTHGYREKIVGYIGLDEESGIFTASTDGEELENVTHFIDLTPFDL